MGAAEDWARCRPWIEAALPETHSIEDIEAGIERYEYHFWPGERCAAVTEFQIYPRLMALNFFLLGGDLRELRRMEPVIREWAAERGCTLFTGKGRPAWGRALRKLGYRQHYVEFGRGL